MKVRKMMAKWKLILPTILALTACTSTSVHTFTKPDTPIAVVAQSETECRVEANRLFPAANFPQHLPVSGYYGYGGWGISGHIQTTDVNSGMRAEHYRDCMTIQGYQPVTHPICTQAQLGGQMYQSVDYVPAPNPNICAVRHQGGSSSLIDLSKPL